VNGSRGSGRRTKAQSALEGEDFGDGTEGLAANRQKWCGSAENPGKLLAWSGNFAVISPEGRDLSIAVVTLKKPSIFVCAIGKRAEFPSLLSSRQSSEQNPQPFSARQIETPDHLLRRRDKISAA
jgi:hypothetical protein